MTPDNPQSAVAEKPQVSDVFAIETSRDHMDETGFALTLDRLPIDPRLEISTALDEILAWCEEHTSPKVEQAFVMGKLAAVLENKLADLGRRERFEDQDTSANLELPAATGFVTDPETGKTRIVYEDGSIL